MYLLNLLAPSTLIQCGQNLHSTMYLLNLNVFKAQINEIIFTFHYVSIKFRPTQRGYQGQSQFTFHYVSIKSNTFRLCRGGLSYLHSTMYLLNHQLLQAF